MLLATQLAAAAISTVLFQLAHDLHAASGSQGGGRSGGQPLEGSEWSYFMPRQRSVSKGCRV